jgi:hypothetical protein
VSQDAGDEKSYTSVEVCTRGIFKKFRSKRAREEMGLIYLKNHPPYEGEDGSVD